MKNRIKELRNRDNITQEELADRLGTSKSMVSMLESGDRRLNTDWITKLCDLFSVRPSEVFVSDLDYRETIIAEKISQLGPEALQQLEEYTDFLLQKHSQSTAEPPKTQAS